MKKIVLFIFILIFFACALSVCVYGQDRVNLPVLKFNSESPKLTRATGWWCSAGVWTSRDNVIYEMGFNGAYHNKESMSLENQNFISIQTKTIFVNDIKYYVIVIEKLTGRFKYPALMIGYAYYPTTIGYIYSVDEYNKINDDSADLKCLAFIEAAYPYDESRFTNSIRWAITESVSRGDADASFYIRRTTSDGESVVRFYLPKSKLGLAAHHFDFETKYFEVLQNEFNMIILI